MSVTSIFLETPSWALVPPTCYQQYLDKSQFPELGSATKQEKKPLTTFKRPVRPVAEPKPKQAPEPAPLSPEQIHRAHIIDESVHSLQMALANPTPTSRGAPVCGLQSRMQFMRDCNSFTSDLCLLPEALDISKIADWSKLGTEVSLKLHTALAKQCGRDNFSVSVCFSKDKKANGTQRYNVRATVRWSHVPLAWAPL
jgi:hypothetical protein